MPEQDCPLVSVVCLTYKKFDYIKSNIASVMAQDYPRMEYIISDDGSPCFPKEEIERYISESKGNKPISVRILRHEKNVGTVKNINNAYREANGEYLIPLASDDEFASPGVVSQIVERFLSTGADVLETSRVLCELTGETVRYQPYISSRRYVEKHINTPYKQYLANIFSEYYDAVAGSTLYIRKEFLQRNGYFDERYRLLEDWPFLTDYSWDRCITYAFDIVSIRYRLGGITNSTEKKIHLLSDMETSGIAADLRFYNSNTRMAHYGELDRFAQRKLRYASKRYDAATKQELIRLWLSFPDVMLTKVVYALRCKWFDDRDKRKRNRDAAASR